MSHPNDRTPLLRDQQGLPVPVGSMQVQDHPIFLRACHSPVSAINQTSLVYIRAFLVAYLTAVGGMLINFKYNRGDEHSAWRIPFQFSTVSFFLLWLYHLLTFSWAFTHLYYPDVDKDDNRWDSKLLRAMSPPTQTAYPRKRLYFSIFYTTVSVFTFMNTVVYWAILVPNDHGRFPKPGAPTESPVKDFLLGSGWFQWFCILNQWGVSSLISVFEILFLNSIKPQVPVPSHIFFLIVFSALYIGYAAFGWVLTGRPPYSWLDPENESTGKREDVAAYSADFLFLAPTLFALMYGLIGIREKLTQKDDSADSISPGEFQAIH